MSIDRCDRCSRSVDTDDDCEFYVEAPRGDGRAYDPMTKGLCERCRERLETEKENGR